MSDTDNKIDTGFEGVCIEGQNPKVKESDEGSNDNMSDDSSGFSDDSGGENESVNDDGGVDTDFSDVNIEGSSSISTVDTPDVSAEDSTLNGDASETWGENKDDIRINTDELNETTKSTSESGTKDNQDTGTKPDFGSQSGSGGDTRNSNGRSDTDTDFSDVDIEGAISDSEQETDSRSRVDNDVRADNEDSDLTESSQSSPQTGSDSNATTKTDTAKTVSTKQLNEVGEKRIRSPIEILTSPLRGLIDTGKFIASVCVDSVILSLMLSGLVAKFGFAFALFNYIALTAFIIVLPPLVGMHFVSNGVVDPNPSRVELFTMISIVFIPILLFLWGVNSLGKYLEGDSNNASSEEKSRFSRW